MLSLRLAVIRVRPELDEPLQKVYSRSFADLRVYESDEWLILHSPRAPTARRAIWRSASASD